jgi:hypothetical protein
MTLSDTITQMLADAQRQPGQIQIRRLPHGLNVQIKIQDDTTSLGISLIDTLPSLTEWRTVLRALPYRINIERPLSGISRDRRFTLWAEWPTPEQKRLVD